MNKRKIVKKDLLQRIPVMKKVRNLQVLLHQIDRLRNRSRQRSKILWRKNRVKKKTIQNHLCLKNLLTLQNLPENLHGLTLQVQKKAKRGMKNNRKAKRNLKKSRVKKVHKKMKVVQRNS